MRESLRAIGAFTASIILLGLVVWVFSTPGTPPDVIGHVAFTVFFAIGVVFQWRDFWNSTN